MPLKIDKNNLTFTTYNHNPKSILIFLPLPPYQSPTPTIHSPPPSLNHSTITSNSGKNRDVERRTVVCAGVFSAEEGKKKHRGASEECVCIKRVLLCVCVSFLGGKGKQVQPLCSPNLNSLYMDYWGCCTLGFGLSVSAFLEGLEALFWSLSGTN